MTSRRAVVLLPLLVVIVGLLSPRSRAPTSGAVGPAPGNRAPEFRLETSDGKEVSLSGLRGKAVLLNFWATYCGPCRVEVPWLVELDARYRPRGLVIVGISMDDPGHEGAVADFARARGVGYTVLMGDTALADAYGGVRLLPQTFLIDRQGTITKAITGLADRKDLEQGVQALLGTVQAARGPEE